MQYEIIPTPRFEKDIKYYMRKKKYTNIIEDISGIINNLEKGNFVGDDINDIKIKSDNHTYKVRSANSNTKVGESNGYRLIYYVVKDDKNIPDKKEIASIIKEYC